MVNKKIAKNVWVNPTTLHSENGRKNVIQTQVNAFTLIASHLSLYNDKNMM